MKKQKGQTILAVLSFTGALIIGVASGVVFFFNKIDAATAPIQTQVSQNTLDIVQLKDGQEYLKAGMSALLTKAGINPATLIIKK